MSEYNCDENLRRLILKIANEIVHEALDEHLDDYEHVIREAVEAEIGAE